MKILVTGSKGYIAKKIIKSLSSFEVEAINRDNFNLVDKEQTDNFFKDKNYNLVIHTAIQGGSRLKPENEETFFNNLKMFYNIINNKNHFKKFISLGSGAEIHSINTYYGLSKKIINDVITNNKNFYNVRIFGLFDHDEWESRFIKSNINRYINKQDIIIHHDKFMDFFYMDDLLQIINNIANGVETSNLIECCYGKKYKLSDIAKIINNLDQHKVNIKIENNNPGKDYIGGEYKKFNVVGIEKGIQTTYKKILINTGNNI
jgi:nucleoside-diphosphate-sugar epimerase